MASEPKPRPEGIAGSELTGPFPVGAYAAMLKRVLRERERVQIYGEVFNLRTPRGAKVYFELRDGTGAVQCSMWRNDWDANASAATVADGAQIVVAGGPDYYPGSRTSSPSFSFLVADLRVAGEGDLLAQIDRLRKQLAAEGLLEPQKRLHIPRLPRSIGVVTGEGGKARDDVLAALRRRGWAGRLVWGFAPVQDRRAAPQITRVLTDMAACAGVEAIVVARGGGSLADLLCFCDEGLCRTVALLDVPVIASVGHHTDRTLLDDVAAVSCSTPTHAAEAAVPLHCGEARVSLVQSAVRLQRHGRRAVLERARVLARLSRTPAEHVARHRRALHQQTRELRAASRRRLSDERATTRTRLLVIERRAAATAASLEPRRKELERLALTLAAHDPERTLERGYALVEDEGGTTISAAAAARAAGRISVRFADGRVPATVEDES